MFSYETEQSICTLIPETIAFDKWAQVSETNHYQYIGFRKDGFQHLNGYGVSGAESYKSIQLQLTLSKEERRNQCEGHCRQDIKCSSAHVQEGNVCSLMSAGSLKLMNGYDAVSRHCPSGLGWSSSVGLCSV
jgi:hypothetical protein